MYINIIARGKTYPFHHGLRRFPPKPPKPKLLKNGLPKNWWNSALLSDEWKPLLFVLNVSGFDGCVSISTWVSSGFPIDPLIESISIEWKKQIFQLYIA